MLKWLLIIVLVGYGGLLLLVYLGQRALQYFPERARTPPLPLACPKLRRSCSTAPVASA